MTPSGLQIRPFAPGDAQAVRALFITINRTLAPSHLQVAFESYIARSLVEEIDRLEAYYAERDGSFWVATRNGRLVGMFGLERAGPGAMELRRMYVAPEAQRQGVARTMLAFAEAQARAQDAERLVLSTSELQTAALALYRASGYIPEREESAASASNKTVGNGIRRYHFIKHL